MEFKIEDIISLVVKKVPGHAKLSGFKGMNKVLVVVPSEDTKLCLTIFEPVEVLEREVTKEGKILGLTKYIGKDIIVINRKD